ncbi:MAG: phosphotransferase family protein [Beijerinckiaceae bacterium]
MDVAASGRLGAWLSAALGAETIVGKASRLSGGAIQENWMIEATVGGRPRAFVIRKDAASTIAASHSRKDEFALIRAARAAGVTVPEPVAFCDNASVLGGPFAVMAKVEGQGFGPKIVKDGTIGGDREKLAFAIGRQMALIHAIEPPRDDLSFLGAPPADSLAHEIALMRDALDKLGLVRPALEWGLAWLSRQELAPGAVTLVHRDFRTGNYMVDGSGLTAVLDWEFAGWGDPMLDLGWFCAECWRFSRKDLEAGGIGSREALYAGYESAAPRKVDDRAVRLWEIMAHIRWAVVALQQGARHLSGREPSLEHALTGRIAPELELAVMRACLPEAA